jgi:hypothetical protein
MVRSSGVGLALAAAATLAACATTRFDSTWKAPDAQPLNLAGRKVAALVISPDESVRLNAEGTLARELTARGLQGLPAYNLIPPNEARDKDKAKALFTAAGIDAVVVLRALGQEKEISASPVSIGYWSAPYYGSFWGSGYYGHGWGAVYEPGYLRTDTIVSVETLVYDMATDKLVWAGRSQTTNPSKVDAFIEELVTGVAGEMKKQGLIRSR